MGIEPITTIMESSILLSYNEVTLRNRIKVPPQDYPDKTCKSRKLNSYKEKLTTMKDWAREAFKICESGKPNLRKEKPTITEDWAREPPPPNMHE